MSDDTMAGYLSGEVARLTRERDEARAVARDHHLHGCESCMATESDLIAERTDAARLREALLGLFRWGERGHDPADLEPWLAARRALEGKP